MPTPTFTQPELEFPRTTPDDLRVVHFLGRKARDQVKPKVVIIGYPGDQGIKLNRGRPGAAEGPDAIRRSFYKLTPDPVSYDKFCELLCYTRDLGNLKMSGDVQSDQEMLAEVVAGCLAQKMVPVVLGGGQEASFGHFLGYVRADKNVNIINWDAHSDVRELIEGQGHSGSTFRQALEHPSRRCIKYTVAGLLPHASAKKHLEYIDRAGGDYVFGYKLTPEKISEIYSLSVDTTMVTVDLDCVDQVHAPGVSAPSAGGIEANLLYDACLQAGRTATVNSLDVTELNPRFDIDGRTARLAAVALWHFLKGMTERPAT
jgi:formiminoglutamase